MREKNGIFCYPFEITKGSIRYSTISWKSQKHCTCCYVINCSHQAKWRYASFSHALTSFLSDQFLLDPWFFSLHILLSAELSPFYKIRLCLSSDCQFNGLFKSSSSWANLFYVADAADIVCQEHILPCEEISDRKHKSNILVENVHFGTS